jgi:F-type H+-transporting ATPase subunit b
MQLQLGTALFQLVIFIILLVLVGRLAMRPALGILERRQQRIADEITAAEKNRQEAAQLLEEQRKLLKDARDESYQLIERAKKQSELESQKIIESAKAEASRLLEDARREIETEKEKAMATLRDQVASLSVLLASKIIEKELDVQSQQNLVDQFMKQVGEK